MLIVFRVNLFHEMLLRIDYSKKCESQGFWKTLSIKLYFNYNQLLMLLQNNSEKTYLRKLLIYCKEIIIIFF